MADVAGRVVGMATVQVLISTAEGGPVLPLADAAEPDAAVRAAAAAALRAIDSRLAWGKRPGNAFSGLSLGSILLLAIGRALVGKPKLLILDEPTEGIQPSIIKDIERAIRTLGQGGETAVLLVEQYYDFARSLAGQYLVMVRGEIMQRGRGSDMAADNVQALLAV